MNISHIVYAQERSADQAAIEQMNKRIFGAARFTRASFFVREGGDHDLSISFIGCREGHIVGSVRQSHIAIGRHHALLLGPLVVGVPYKNVGLGAGLMNRALEAAREKNHRLVLLVGDMSYYGRFGFIVADSHHIIMPAPVNPKRLLACELVPNALHHVSGLVRHQSCIRAFSSQK